MLKSRQLRYAFLQIKEKQLGRKTEKQYFLSVQNLWIKTAFVQNKANQFKKIVTPKHVHVPLMLKIKMALKLVQICLL